MPRQSLAKTGDVVRPAIMVDRRRRAPEQVYQELRRAILALEYLPGSPLTEANIAERAAISRTPVREALRRLQNEGLVEIFPNLGSFVSRIDTRQAEEAVIIRALLEGEAAARAAPLGPDLARQLEAIISDQQRATENGESILSYTLDEHFHCTIFDAVQLPLMWENVRGARANLERLRHLMAAEAGSPAMAVAAHRAIARAIRDRDANDARTAMTAHVEANRRFLEAIRAQQHHFLKDLS